MSAKYSLHMESTMKKTGFTLAELLITLAVIGIISAITLPAINKLMPDENKINCIKAYDTLSTLIKDLASNTKIYPVCKDPGPDDDNLNCSEYPLFNTNQPRLLAAFNNERYSGDKKLCNLLASFMNVEDTSCEDDVYNFNAANFDTQFNNNKSFITANGMQWYVVPAVASAYADDRGTFQTDVYVDVNGDKAPNCIYNADACEKPDRFKFMVAADGTVEIADPVSREYINSRRNFNRSQLDIAGDGAFLANVNNRNFDISRCREADDDSLGCDNSDGLPEMVVNIGGLELFNHSFATFVPNPVKVEVLVYSLKNPELRGLYDENMCVPTALGSTVSSNPMITYDFTWTSDGITNISPYSYGQGYDLNSICQKGSWFLFDKVDVYMTINGLRKKDCNTDGINFYTWRLY